MVVLESAASSENRPSRPRPTIIPDTEVTVDRRISTAAGARLSVVLRHGNTPTHPVSALTKSKSGSLSSLSATLLPHGSAQGSLSGSDFARSPSVAIPAQNPFRSSNVTVQTPTSPAPTAGFHSSPVETAVDERRSTIRMLDSPGISRDGDLSFSKSLQVAAIPVKTVEDVTVWSDVGSIRRPKKPFIARAKTRWHRTSRRRKVCGFLILVVVVMVVAAAVGLGVGLGRKNKKSGGHADASTATTTGTARPDSSSSSSASPTSSAASSTSMSADQIVGKHSIVLFLDTSQSDCVTDSALWSCPPNNDYNTSPDKSYAVFNWEIQKSSTGSGYSISSTDTDSTSASGTPANGLEFYNQPLELVNQGKSDERYTFQTTFDKIVSPASIAVSTQSSRIRRGTDQSSRSVSDATCVYSSTNLRVSLFTNESKTYPSSTTRPIPTSQTIFSEWPFAVQVEEIVAAQSELTVGNGGVSSIPVCYSDSGLKSRLVFADGQVKVVASNQPAELCSCLYGNRKV